MIFLISFGLIDLYAQSNLKVTEYSGENSSFLITDIRKLTFSGGNLNVISLNGSLSLFEISAIKKLNFTSMPTSIQNEKSDSKVQLYPNPTKDSFLIEDDTADGNEIEVEIIDMAGNLLQKQLINLPARIDLSGCKNGIYICRLNMFDKIESIKIIKK